MSDELESDLIQWLNEAVLGLGLCPFAAGPLAQKRVRIVYSGAGDDASLVQELHKEITHLQEVSARQIETTLLVVATGLSDFYAFNDFLRMTDQLLAACDWRGVFQIASFHPRYRFAGTREDAVENLTNRAPYPILQILREASVTEALSRFGDSRRIYERNIATVTALTEEQKRQVFPFLFD